jgi:tetratricopeptide (TPR) repeat protein
MGKSSVPRQVRAQVARYRANAERLLRAGMHSKAMTELSRAAELMPSDAGVLNDVGSACLFAKRPREASEYLRRSVDIRPNAPHSHFNLGLALEDLGDREGALEAYRNAVFYHSEFPEALGRLADILWELGKRREAVQAYDRASSLVPNGPQASLWKAISLSATDRHDEAIVELSSAITLDGHNATAHAMLGKVLQEVGRFDEAIVSFEHALTLDPLQSAAYQGLVSSKRMTECDRPWLSGILSLLNDTDWSAFAPAVSDRHRMVLHFAAGKALDDLGEFGSAMTHFNEANRIRRTMWPFDAERLGGRVERIIERFSAKSLVDQAGLGCRDETPVLIVGMPRSGTTLLERIVCGHPQVHGRGELEYWPEQAPKWLDAGADRLRTAVQSVQGDYLDLLRSGSGDARRCVDKMPFNFLWVGLIHLLFPGARFIHARRNPVDTCLSIYMTPLRASWGFLSELKDLAVFYRAYLRLMAHWRTIVPSSRLLEVDYEDIVVDPATSTRQLLEFCGLEWADTCLRPNERQGAVRTASHWQVRQPIYQRSVERWRNYEPWIGELGALLGKG